MAEDQAKQIESLHLTLEGMGVNSRGTTDGMRACTCHTGPAHACARKRTPGAHVCC